MFMYHRTLSSYVDFPILRCCFVAGWVGLNFMGMMVAMRGTRW